MADQLFMMRLGIIDYPIRLKDLGDGTYAPSYYAGGNAGYAPVGNHSSGDTISAAIFLTKPTGASKIVIQALTQNVRFTLDATPPTAVLGFQILAGAAPMIIEVPGAFITVIQEAATASLQYQWVS